MTYKLFLSSPSDVNSQRDIVVDVVAGINADERGDNVFEIVDWRKQGFTAAESFQPQVIRPSSCDIVICITHKTAGTELDEAEYNREDGSQPTGTEWEFEDALSHALAVSPKTPDIYFYRRTSALQLPARDPGGEKRRQFERLEKWFESWSLSERGTYIAASHSFKTNQDFKQTVREHLKQFLDRRRKEVTWADGSPFRGLKAYEEQHHRIFFGRAGEVERIRARYLRNRQLGTHFLLITGPSGSGKSSVVRAGLIPRLQGPNGIPEAAQVFRLVVRMGNLEQDQNGLSWEDTFIELLLHDDNFGSALAEGDSSTAETLRSLFAAGGAAALTPFSGVHARLGKTKNIIMVLVLDQFEELLNWPDEQIESFCSMLENVCVPNGIDVIATMRSDFSHHLSEIPALVRLRGGKQPKPGVFAVPEIEISPPSGQDLFDMISGPAVAAGLRYEPGKDGEEGLQAVIEREARPDALPALQSLLAELYEKRSDNDLMTRQAYDTIGGIAGAMAYRGETVLTHLRNQIGEDESNSAFEKLMRKLVDFSTGSDIPVAKTISLENATAEGHGKLLLEELRQAGLLTSHDRRIRIAHESLLQHWGRLKSLINNEKKLLQTFSRLSERALLYGLEPTPRRLLQGLDLQEGKDLSKRWGDDAFDDDDPLPGLISASEKRRRLVLFTRISIALLIGSIGIGTYVYVQAERTEALIAKIQAAATREALLALNERNWTDALLKSAEAYRLLPNPTTRSLLARAIVAYPPKLLAFRKGDYRDINWSSNGTLTVLRTEHQEPSIVEVDQFSPDGSYRSFNSPTLEDDNYLVRLILNSGEKLFGVLRDGSIAQIDFPNTKSGQKLHVNPTYLPIQPDWMEVENRVVVGRTSDLAISEPSGRLVSVLTDSSTLTVSTCQPRRLANCKSNHLQGQFEYPSLSVNGKYLAVSKEGNEENGEKGSLILKNLQSGSVQFLSYEGKLSQLSWHPTLPRIQFVLEGEKESNINVYQVGDDESFFKFNIFSDTKLTIPYGNENSGTRASHWLGKGEYVINYTTGPWQAIYNANEKTRKFESLLYDPYGSSIRQLITAGNGQEFVVRYDDGIRLWDGNKPVGPSRFYGKAAVPIFGVQNISRKYTLGRTPGARIDAWHIVVFDNENGSYIRLTSEQSQVQQSQAAISKEGKIAVLAAGTGAFGVDLSDSDKLFKCGHSTGLAITWLDEDTVAYTNGANQVEICNLNSSDEKSQVFDLSKFLPFQHASIWGITSDENGGLLISVSDGSILHWTKDQTKVAVKADVVEDNASASTIDLHPTKPWLVASRNDGIMKIYDWRSGTELSSIRIERETGKIETSVHVSFSPNGRRLTVVDADGYVHIFEVSGSSGRMKKSFHIDGKITDVFGDPDKASVHNITWLNDQTLLIPNGKSHPLELDIIPDNWLRHADKVSKGLSTDGFSKALAKIAVQN